MSRKYWPRSLGWAYCFFCVFFRNSFGMASGLVQLAATATLSFRFHGVKWQGVPFLGTKIRQSRRAAAPHWACSDASRLIWLVAIDYSAQLKLQQQQHQQQQQWLQQQQLQQQKLMLQATSYVRPRLRPPWHGLELQKADLLPSCPPAHSPRSLPHSQAFSTVLLFLTAYLHPPPLPIYFLLLCCTRQNQQNILLRQFSGIK